MKNVIALGICILLTSCYSSENNAQESQTISADQILELINSGKAVSLKDKIISGDLDLTKVKNRHKIAPSTFKVSFEKALYFENCVFEGSILGFHKGQEQTSICSFRSDFIIDQCRVKGSVNLSQGRFHEFFYFKNSETEGTFTVSSAIFHDISDLRGSRFEKDLELTYAHFRDHSSFMNLKIYGKTYLQGVHFDKRATWSNSIFEQYVDLSKINSKDAFMLDFCEFNGPLIISGSAFLGYVNITHSKFNDRFTIRTSIFLEQPVLDQEAEKTLQTEKNRFLVDDNYHDSSIDK